MMILALDTTMAACSAAVLDTASQRILASIDEAMDRGHAEAIAPMVQRVLAVAGASPRALERIVVTTGPGTFTGVRIGLAMARGLGLSLTIPIVGIDSLRAIAANVPGGRSLILVACHARHDETYAALYGPDAAVIRDPAVMPLSAAADLAPEGAFILGTAADAIMKLPGVNGLVRSHAGDLPLAARFGWLGAGDTDSDSIPEPLYLRAPDARPQADRQASESIVTVGREGAEMLAALHAASLDRPWSASALAALLATPGTCAAVLIHEGEPAGFILTRQAAGEAEILTIVVQPSLRRRGIAGRLLAGHLGQLAAQGVEEVFLEVAQSNAAARSLYDRLGFAVAGRRPHYYSHHGRTEDAIVMRRVLAR